MFLQHCEPFSHRPDDGFGQPVESIMRCEDFKSNFARKLSNRYVSRSPLTSLKSDGSLRLCPSGGSTERTSEIVQDRMDAYAQVLKTAEKEQSVEIVKPPDKFRPNTSDKRKIEAAALNMEMETLKWQLAQTEANRQMHIALLKQIVTFLNRVKEKIGCKEETLNRRDRVNGKVLPNSFSSADLPRSRSVVHVNNKSLDYLPNSPKKVSSRKISKSISNVNGFKELNNSWNQSKLSLMSETESTQKISEEMSRLITLANTVLSTNIPDLTNSFDKPVNESKLYHKPDKDMRRKYGSTLSLNRIEEDPVNKFICNGHSTVTDFDNKIPSSDSPAVGYNVTPSTTVIEDEIASIELNELEHYTVDPTNSVMENKNVEYNRPVNFIEDESGFSSMSSFQEIGIPVINIIPPSPCKGMGYDDEMPSILEEKEKWKTEALQLDKQSMKVFWV